MSATTHPPHPAAKPPVVAPGGGTPASRPDASRPRDGILKLAFLLAFSGFIVVGGAYGFFGKILKFILAWMGSEDDRFALVPVAMYFCVAVGFACIFVWAIANGQLHDIEGPKYRMLENEKELEDLEEKEPQDPWA